MTHRHEQDIRRVLFKQKCDTALRQHTLVLSNAWTHLIEGVDTNIDGLPEQHVSTLLMHAQSLGTRGTHGGNSASPPRSAPSPHGAPLVVLTDKVLHNADAASTASSAEPTNPLQHMSPSMRSAAQPPAVNPAASVPHLGPSMSPKTVVRKTAMKLTTTAPAVSSDGKTTKTAPADSA
jgi:hypothetical protein